MDYRIRLVASPGDLPGEVKQILSDLDAQTFPTDTPEPLQGRYWWLVTNLKGQPVGFAGMKEWTDGKSMYFCRAGVLARHRQRGLHRRMISARVKYARRLGAQSVLTYTSHQNSTSINSLIARGFKAFVPDEKWAGSGFCYWRKELT